MKHSDWDVNLYREHIEPFTIGLTTSHLLQHEHQHLLYGQLIHTYQHIKEMVAISNQVGALYQVGVLYQVGALYQVGVLYQVGALYLRMNLVLAVQSTILDFAPYIQI